MSELSINNNSIAVSEKSIEANQIHQRIISNIEFAANSLIQVCIDLKTMRDDKLYIELGFNEFEEYTEKAVGIKKRQAYNYIKVLERLPKEVLQSNAHLGITKLELLTQIPDIERGDFLEDSDLAGMSTDELAEIVKSYKEQGEQLSLLKEENEELKSNDTEDYQELKSTIAKLESDLAKKNKELEKKPIEVAVAEMDPAQIKKIEAEAKKTAKAEYDKKLDKEVEKQVSAVKEQTLKEAEEKFKSSLSIIEAEKAQALSLANELDNKLKLAGDQSAVKLSLYFENLNAAVEKIRLFIGELSSSGHTETAEKYRGALISSLVAIQEQLTQEG